MGRERERGRLSPRDRSDAYPRENGSSRQSRSRSRSPRKRSRDREGRDRGSRHDRNHRDTSRNRQRDRNRQEDRETDRDKDRHVGDRKRHSDRDKGSSHDRKKPKVDLSSCTNVDEDMMKQMGFSNFDTTKNKHVADNVDGAIKINKNRKYRQYMNRKGGFNRPLDYVA